MRRVYSYNGTQQEATISTRAIYTFCDEHAAIHVYKHHDGYPSGAARFIKNATSRAWELPRFEADDFAAAFVAANKDRGGGVRLVGQRLDGSYPKPHEIAADAEYRYEITHGPNGLHVKAFSCHYWDDKPSATLFYEGDVEGLATAEDSDA